MPEKVLEKSAAFPFESVSPKIRSTLARFVGKYDGEGPPHPNLVTLLNILLVWSGARTATLPSWEYCDKFDPHDFIQYLNTVSPPHVEELRVLYRHQIYSSGNTIMQGFVVRLNNPRVLTLLTPPMNDAKIGRVLDIYHVNADHFANQKLGDQFSIWEAESEALMYAEAWDEDLLTPTELDEFLAHCKKRVELWNTAMEKLGLPYRFYGTMDWKRSEIPWNEAEKTTLFFGKPYIGVDHRGKVYREPLSRKKSDLRS